MLKKILATPLVVTIVLSAAILAGMLAPNCPWQALENKNYDFLTAFFRSPSNQPIAIIAIDDESIRKYGDWPWPRSRLTEMINLLSTHGAAALGICQLYTQPEHNPALEQIDTLRAQIADPKFKLDKKSVLALEELLHNSQEDLNEDTALISAVRKDKNVVLPIVFTKVARAVDTDGRMPGLLNINSFSVTRLPPEPPRTAPDLFRWLNREQLLPLVANGVLTTFEELASKAGALGHLNHFEDPDGVLRRTPLLIEYEGRLFPSLSLQVALKFLDARLGDLTIERGFLRQTLLNVKQIQINTDGAFNLLVNLNPRWLKQRTFSFSEVMGKNISASVFKDKIVFIGLTSKVLAPSLRLGAGGRASSVEINAGALSAILAPVRLSIPAWALWLEMGALLYFAFFLVFVIPRVSIKLGAAIVAVFIVSWYAMTAGLLLGYGYHVRWTGPVLLAGCGFIIIQIMFYSRKQRQEILDANKTLGLTYQGQGLLDMAYERFMLCPMEDSTIRNLLYNLALDFERKRMFNKALAIYKQIRNQGAFMDIDQRCERLKAIEGAAAMSPAAGRTERPLIIGDAKAKPTIGRYEIVRELGRGAMGTVYLGRDPKINREVAIKTLAYAAVGPSELKEVKTRFFREAQAAGNLSHPNIVSIYDVGEEHDMAYIAMEVLNGRELTVHCQTDNLLPPARVLAIIADVSQALEYAHRKGVVHRDIKPANIMVLADDRVKVTDFSIAQVIDASKTRTGEILGTPNYMSPEQIAGEKIDGRSDLFSLGIILYELLSGKKPFKGDTLTALAFAIAQTPHAPLLSLVTDLPPCCEAIVNKLLAKKASNRYASAAQVTSAIEACRDVLR